jgi:hypothetical protein
MIERRLERRGEGAHAGPRSRRDIVPTGWDGWPAVLSRGGVHEWFGPPDGQTDGRTYGRWTPPLLILVHLARQALLGKTEKPESRKAETTAPGRWVLWVGRAVWPHPRVLVRASRDEIFHASPVGDDRRLLERSLFIDPPDIRDRVWTLDLALRCPTAAVVIGDGSALDIAQTRRLQLAAEAGGALALLARPPHEQRKPSAAATRWQVACAPTAGDGPRWDVRLLRCKGPSRISDSQPSLPGGLLEWEHAKGHVHPPAAVVDRPDAAARIRRTG